MTHNNREHAWNNIRLIELLFTLALGVLLIVGFSLKVSGPVFWTSCVLVYGVSLWIWWREYQVLDEFGRLIFLKSWMVNGVVTSSGLSLVVLWTLLHSNVPFTSSAAALIPVPIWWVYPCLLAGLLGMGLTNLYLRRSPRA